MAKFDFRLEKLFEYRQLQEKWAKDEYLACMAKRIEGEDEVQRIYEAVAVHVGGVTHRIAGADGAAEACKDETGIERVNQPVTVGVAFAVGWAGEVKDVR